MHSTQKKNICMCREKTFGDKSAQHPTKQMVRLTERNVRKLEATTPITDEEETLHSLPSFIAIDQLVHVQRPSSTIIPPRRTTHPSLENTKSDSQFKRCSQHTPMAESRLPIPFKSHVKFNSHGSGRKILKKYRSSRMHRVKRQEYKKLREMVPALQEKNKVSKVVVIEEAIKYIDELHSALVQRFRSKGLPSTFNGRFNPQEVHGGNIKDLIRLILANANPTSLPPTKIENIRTLPSFLQKRGRRHKKS